MGRRNTPQVRGTTQSVVHGTLTQIYTSHMCPEEGGVYANRCTHTQAQEGCEHMYSQDIHAHTLTGRFVHICEQIVHIKGLPHVFIHIHM